MANIKAEARKVCAIRLLKEERDEIESYGGWKLYDWVKFLLDYIEKNQNVIQNIKRNTIWEDIWVKRNTNWTNWDWKRNTIWNLNDIIERVMGDTPIEQERIPTPKQAIQIKEIDSLTSGGMKTYWEDWEEYTRGQLMKRWGLEDFI